VAYFGCPDAIFLFGLAVMRFVDLYGQIFYFTRLDQKIKGAKLHSFDGQFHGSMSGQHNDFTQWFQVLNCSQNFGSIHSRQTHVIESETLTCRDTAGGQQYEIVYEQYKRRKITLNRFIRESPC
jgi:hypothetical protein